MNNQKNVKKESNIIIYTTEDGMTKIETTFDEDTVWLSIDQMAELFQRDKSTISRHIKNVLGSFMQSGVYFLIILKNQYATKHKCLSCIWRVARLKVI